MSGELELFERPEAEEIYMLAGWRQWADAGSVSSALPQYLVDTLGARKIGRIKSDGFYIFQTPVSQFFFRPRFKFQDGYRVEAEGPRNDVYYWSNGKTGLVIFLGDEPQLNIEKYAAAFFQIAQELKVKRVAATGGVYAVVPHEKERAFTCSYSHPHLKTELNDYAVSFSNYEGGVSIGSYMNDPAEKLGVEYFSMYAFVPVYDFSQMNQRAQNISVEEDHRAWLDVMRRIDHMFKLGLDLSDLAQKASELTETVNAQIDELAKQLSGAPVKEYIAKITAGFEERPFTALGDVWKDALGDLFNE
jgi:proteasome assembly chaperone (PAC2) family protein